MRELAAVLAAWEEAQAAGSPAALATVVSVQGSAYRRPGARMLIRPDGSSVGGVSGGCLEADVVERARRVLRDGEPIVVTYDTTDGDDILTGVGLGCQGVVRILIEPVTAPDGPLVGLDVIVRERRPAVLATVCGIEGNASVRLGERLLLSENGVRRCRFSDATLAAQVEADARAVLTEKRSRTVRYPVGAATVEVFLESLMPAPALLICGAGNDAQPLASFAKGLGWHVTVADARPAFAVSSRFPRADAVLLSTPEDLPGRVTLDDRTAVVVITHNYRRDLALLRALLPSPACYFGVLGPKTRTACLRQDLGDDGAAPEHLDRLHGPIGLDIGADGPEQIALAVVAEIQAEFSGRPGGPLRHRDGPISAPAVDAPADQHPPSSFPFERAACPL